MDAFIGKWLADRSKDEGVTEFMKASGAPDNFIEMQKAVKGTQEFHPEGNKFAILLGSEFDKNSKKSVFEIGKPFELQTALGQKIKGSFTLDGPTRLIGQFKDKNDVIDSVREVVGNQLVMTTTTTKGGTMKQYFNKV